MDSGTRLRISLKAVYKIIFKKCEIARKLNWSRIEYTLLSRNIWITYRIFMLYLSYVVVPSLFIIATYFISANLPCNFDIEMA